MADVSGTTGLTRWTIPDELALNGVVGAPAAIFPNLFRSRSEWCESWEPLESAEGSFFSESWSSATGSTFAYGLVGTVYRPRIRAKPGSPRERGAMASLFGGFATKRAP